MDVLLEALLDLAFDPSEPRDEKGRWYESPLKREVAYVTGQMESMVRGDGGPDRRLMPQLSGVPAPGSKADKIPHAPGQEVDLTDEFEKELRAKGIEVNDTSIDVGSLKPTQDQLVAAKVEGLAQYMDTAPADDRVYEPIFVTKDDYVIDGHHRWAGQAVRARLDGTTRAVKVRQVNLDREAALDAATKFMDEWGLPRAGMSHSGPTVSTFATPSSDVARKTSKDLSMYLLKDTDLAVTPNGRPADTRALARPGYTGKRKTSDYERAIAHALMRKGKTKSQAIRMARGLLRKAAATGRWGDHGHAGAKTRAGAAASIAQRKTF